MAKKVISKIRKSSDSKWLGDFKMARPNYELFTSKLEVLLKDLLRAKSIDYHLLESRTKTEESFREKITRTSKSYSNPLEQVEDISGIRIITYYQDDADEIESIIKGEFRLDEMSLSVPNAPSEFGYKSSHFVVSINRGRADLLEWKGFGDLKAEIQVRTVLQHAWAAISHKLQYKREEDVPAALRRKLFRLSALFELSDDEFMALRNASGAIANEIESRISAGDNEIAVDYLSIKEFISQSQIINRFVDEAVEVGFQYRPDIDSDSAISDLALWCSKLGLGTLALLERYLHTASAWSRRYLSVQFEANKYPDQENNTWYTGAAFITTLVLFGLFPSSITVEVLSESGWNHSVANNVVAVAKKFLREKESRNKKIATGCAL